MYIQITTRCNMMCPHCCYSCGPTGKDMDRGTFLRSLELASTYGEHVSIGGGEPTVHPLFWDFLGLALGHCEEPELLWLATNGYRTEDALQLAVLARRGILGVTLSRDSFHSPIDDQVVRAFTKNRSRMPGAFNYFPDMRDIRDVSEKVVNTGRAVETGVGNTDGECVCEDLFVAPDGQIFFCGCQDLSLGTVWDPQVDENFFVREDTCSRHEAIEAA